MGLYHFAVGSLFAGILCLPVWGANEGKPAKSADSARRIAQRADEGVGRWSADDEVERLNEHLALTESQQAKVRQLVSDYLREVDRQTRPVVAKNLAELRRLDKRIENNRVAGDTEKIRGLHEQQDKLMGSDQMKSALDKLLSDINAVLPADKKQVNAMEWEAIFRQRWNVDQRVERMNQELTLTQSQQDKIAELIAGYRDEAFKQYSAVMESGFEKIKEISTKRKAALAANDQETLQKLRAEMREILDNDERDAAYEKLTSDIEKVLTAKQKSPFRPLINAALNWLPVTESLFPQAAWLKAHPDVLMRAVQSLKLAPVRQARIEAIFEAAKPKGEAAPGDKPDTAGGPAVYEKVMAELKPSEQAMVKAWQPAPAKGRQPAAR